MNSLVYILGAIGAIIIFSTARVKGKKVMGYPKYIPIFIGVAVLAIGLMAGGIIPDLGLGLAPAAVGGTTTGGTTSGTTTPTGVLCGVSSTVTLAAVDAYAPATATGGSHRYRVNGAPAKYVSDGGTFTASACDSIEVLFFNQSATGAYFSKAVTATIPEGRATFTLSDSLYANGTLSIKVDNEDGDLIDGGATNETIVAGDIPSLDIDIQGTFQKAFPHGGVMVVEFNKTALDDVTLAITGLTETAVPDAYAITLATESRVKAYSVPALLSNAKLSGQVVIDADDSVNPGDAGDPVLTFYASNPYVNEDTGAIMTPAVEDEDNVLTYNHVTSSTIHLS